MRTLIVTAFVSADGVMEAPGGDTGYRSPSLRSGPSERGPSGPGGGESGRPTSLADQLDDDIPF